MSVRYYLTKKGGDGTPVLPVKIDEELCKLLGVPVHEEDYIHGWWDVVGMMAVVNQPLDSTRVRQIYFDQPRLCRILDFLAEHYTLEAGR